MSAVGDARARLFAAAKTVVPSTPWRVHDVTPAQISAPTIFLGSVELGVDQIDTAGIVVATFPIYVIVDGTVRAQIEALDDLVSALWSAVSEAGGDPLSCRSIALDGGGVNLRAQVLRTDVLLAAQTFCAPVLTMNGATRG